MRLNLHRGARRIATVAAIAGLTVIMMTANDAMAQGRGGRGGRGGPGGGPGGGDMMGRMFGNLLQPEFIGRDMPMISHRLSLDDTQRLIVETLIDEYQSAFTEAAETMRTDLSAMRPDRTEDEATQTKRIETFRSMREMRGEMRTLGEAIREGIVADPASAQQQLEALRVKQDALRSAAEELRPRMPEGEELEAMQEEAKRVTREWQQMRRHLRVRFLGDLQIILTEKQLPAWDSFLREIRREKSLMQGRLAGENVNLFHMVRDVELADPVVESLEELLLAYELQLDAALVARDTLLETSRFDFMLAMMSRQLEEAIELAEAEAAVRVQVRNTNETFAQAMMDALEPGDAEMVRVEWRMQAYPRVYRSRGVMPAFETAKALPDITEDILAGIMALEDAYLGDRDLKNTAIVSATRENEPNEAADRFRRFAERMNNPPQTDARDEGVGRRGRWQPERGENPIFDATNERRELDTRYRGLLESLLTPEQIAQLPVERQRGGRGGRGGEGGRGGRGGGGGGGDGGGTGGPPGTAGQRLLERFDTDGDGKLSNEEMQQMQEQRRRGRDRNDDGPIV
jgi:uncharacterized membrane protein YgcG